MVGEKIKKIRKALNLTLKEFANPLKITHGYVSQIEKGDSEPKESLIEFIIYYYSVSRVWWDTGEGPMFSKHQSVPLTDKIVTMLNQMPEDERQKIQAAIEERYEHYKHHEKCLTLEAEIEELKRLIGDKKIS